jgi:DNA replication and repair protein RecF
MGVLWLKWNEMDYVERERSERPILLLDDIFSELDEKHQHMVVELAHKQQTIFTTTDLRGLDTLKKKTVIEI